MLLEQDYTCLVCGTGPLLREGRANLSSRLDHCHDCGQLRGLVCKRCNALIGFIESNTDAFRRALAFHIDHVDETHTPNANGALFEVLKGRR
jgi:hypothetical protein